MKSIVRRTTAEDCARRPTRSGGRLRKTAYVQWRRTAQGGQRAAAEDCARRQGLSAAAEDCVSRPSCRGGGRGECESAHHSCLCRVTKFIRFKEWMKQTKRSGHKKT